MGTVAHITLLYFAVYKFSHQLLLFCLGHLIQQFEAAKGSLDGTGRGGAESGVETQLFPTLYVGEFAHGLFAVPSLVDQQTLRISPARNTPLLIEGPKPEPADSRAADAEKADVEVRNEVPRAFIRLSRYPCHAESKVMNPD
jgi:hypothetical protein